MSLIENIVLEEIKNSFDETSNEVTNKIFMKGYNNVYEYYARRLKSINSQTKFENISYIFSKVTYKKAKKYNNLYTNDRTKYSIETDAMLKMCLYMERYYEFSKVNVIEELKNIIEKSWNKAEKLKHLNLIGYICVINDLPSGEIFLAKKIGSYVYSIDEFEKKKK